jgi:cytidylate kinase
LNIIVSGLTVVDTKDESTARRLGQLHGVDIRTDRSVFDLLLDNSDLITAPTIESARRGISAFHRLLVGMVLERLPQQTLRHG